MGGGGVCVCVCVCGGGGVETNHMQNFSWVFS